MAIFKGAGVAIVTPMYDNEEVNYDKLEELINMQIDNGTDAIIIAGTTGESPCLSMEEHAKVIKAAVEFTKHRVPVVAAQRQLCSFQRRLRSLVQTDCSLSHHTTTRLLRQVL